MADSAILLSVCMMTSGGFTRNFNLDSSSAVTISLDLRLILDGRMESHEFGTNLS